MRDNEFTRQADDFLKEANATCNVRLIGLMRNKNWKEKELRNAYDVTIKTPRGEMFFTFWDSIYNTKIKIIPYKKYTAKRYRECYREISKADREEAKEDLKQLKSDAEITSYDILSHLRKREVVSFEKFCAEAGLKGDTLKNRNLCSKTIKQYNQLRRIFTSQQMELLREIE